jgi:LPXTG-site transpeptidase (sortase) family protein
MQKIIKVQLILFLVAALVLTIPQGVASADISFPAGLNESFNPISISAGGVSTLTIEIYNPNSFPLIFSSSPAAFTETLPADLYLSTPINASNTCGGIVTTSGTTAFSLIGGTVSAQVGGIPGSCKISIDVTSTIANTYDSKIPSKALVATNPTGTLNISNDDPSSVTLTVNSVQPPSLSKSFNSNTIWVGRTSQMTINIKNTDLNSALTRVSVTDSLPTGVSLSTTAFTSNNCGSPVVTQLDGSALSTASTGIKISNATIPVNSSCSVVFTVTSPTPGTYLNSIPAHAIQSQQGVTNASAASAPLNVQNISISKSFSPNNVEAGGTSVLTVTLQNPSTADYTGVGFTDVLPSGMTIYQPAELSTTCETAGAPASVTTDGANAKLILSGGTIPAANSSGVPGRCTVTARITVSTAGSYTNSLPAGSLTTDIPGVTNVTAATANISSYGEGYGLTGSKRFDQSTIAVNGTSKLSITLNAPTDTSLSEVSVTDALPDGLKVAPIPAKSIGSGCGAAVFNPQPGDTLLSFSNGTIPQGGACTFSVYVIGTKVGTFTNTISRTNISTKEGRNISGNITGKLTVSGLSVKKTFTPTVVNKGGTSTLTVEISNINSEQLNSVHFLDTLPSGLVIAPTPNLLNTCNGSVDVTPGGSTIELTGGVIPAQVSNVAGICTVNVDVQALTENDKVNTIAAGAVTGTLAISGISISNPQPTSATLSVHTLIININKSFDPILVSGYGSSTLTVLLQNPNSYPLVGIKFTDDLPQSGTAGSGVTIAPAPNASVGTCGGTISATPGATSFSFSGGNLNINQSCTLSVDVVMNYDGNLINIIPVGDPLTGTGVTSTNGGSNDKEGRATLTNIPGASVTKKFSSVSGHDATLTITINNLNSYQITNVGLSDTFPEHVSVVSAAVDQCNGTVTTTSGSVTLAGGSIVEGGSCDITVQVEADQAGSFLNCIPSDSLTNDQNTTNTEDACDTLTVTNPVNPPQITKTFGSTSIPLGSSSLVTFEVNNPNSVALTGVSFNDTLPTNMTLTSIVNVVQCGGTVSSSSSGLSLTNGIIAANTTCKIVANVTTSVAGSFTNTTSTVTSTNGGTGNDATDDLLVVAPPQIAKSFSPASILAGENSTLTFVIQNPPVNSVSLTGVSFSDALPTGVKVATTPAASVSSSCGSATFNPAAGDTSLTFSGGTIAAADSCTVSVDVTAASGGSYLNTSGNVTSTNGGTGNSASDTLDVSGPGLTLQKSTTTANYQKAGDTLAYSYLLTNSGNTILYPPFVVHDDHITGDIDCTNSLISLDPGATTTCTAAYTVTDADVTAKSVTNLATATAKDEHDNDVNSNQSSATVDAAALTIDKSTSTVSYLTTGNKINYSYTLTNTGSVTLYSPFTVTDDHIGTPLGTAFVCGTVTSLAPGENATCTSVYTVTAADVAADNVMNQAFATGYDAASGGKEVKSNTDTVTVPKVTHAMITKAFNPATIAVGQTSTMMITIQNPNLVPLTGVNFTDTFPAGLTVVNPPDTAQCGGTVSWNSSTGTLSLASGSIIGTSCTITALVTSNAAGVYTNTTSTVKTTNGGTGNSATADLTVVQTAVITKSFNPSTVLQGQTSTLMLVINNPTANTQDLTGISFTDPLPTGMSVATDPQMTLTNCGALAAFNPVAGDTSLTFSGGSLAIGQNCTLTVNVIAPAAGTYDNTTAVITSTNGGPGAPSNTATLNVNQTTDLVITKTDSVVDVTRGDTITYAVVVTNNGPMDAVGATVTDALPAQLTAAAWTCSATGGATCTASGTGNLSDTIDVPVGGVATYAITATVADSTAASIANSAVVLPPSDLTDINPANNSATDVDDWNLLTITKSADHSTYDKAGNQIVYTYTVKNDGNSTLKSPFAVIDDKLTPDCPSVPSTLAPAATFTCTGTHTVTAADLDAGSITNHVYATGTTQDGDSIQSNTSSVTVNADQKPLIGLAKRAVSVTNVSANTYDVLFTFVIENYGNVTLHNPQITDNLNTTFPSTTTYAVKSVSSSDLIVNASFNGDSDQQLLGSGNTLAVGESKTLDVVVRVVPTTHGIFYNTATVTAKDVNNHDVTDVSQNGSNPDADGNGNPTNDSEPTPVDFGSHIYEPPLGIKTLNTSQMPMMTWTITWINNQNILPIDNVAHDPIPLDTEYLAKFTDSGIAPPSGAPSGSTSEGVECTVSGKSTTTLCYYEGPTADNPLGQVVWEGTLASDYGVTDPTLANNEVTITFSTTYQQHAPVVNNVATIDTDLNGDGDTGGTGERQAASASAGWVYEATILPVTGFAPNVVTQLPAQPKALAYSAMNDMWIEIPSVNMQSSIMGVPSTSTGWNISWIGKDTGWLNGSAFPTHAGNSVLTGHVVDSNGNPGPFADISKLKYGDKIIIHAWNEQYVYEVREFDTVSPSDFATVFKHEDLSWITLMTCKDFDAKSNTYLQRYLVRAVLIKVQ